MLALLPHPNHPNPKNTPQEKIAALEAKASETSDSLAAVDQKTGVNAKAISALEDRAAATSKAVGGLEEKVAGAAKQLGALEEKVGGWHMADQSHPSDILSCTHTSLFIHLNPPLLSSNLILYPPPPPAHSYLCVNYVRAQVGHNVRSTGHLEDKMTKTARTVQHLEERTALASKASAAVSAVAGLQARLEVMERRFHADAVEGVAAKGTKGGVTKDRVGGARGGAEVQ